jgi:hypothetical protein
MESFGKSQATVTSVPEIEKLKTRLRHLLLFEKVSGTAILHELLNNIVDVAKRTINDDNIQP